MPRLQRAESAFSRGSIHDGNGVVVRPESVRKVSPGLIGRPSDARPSPVRVRATCGGRIGAGLMAAIMTRAAMTVFSWWGTTEATSGRLEQDT